MDFKILVSDGVAFKFGNQTRDLWYYPFTFHFDILNKFPFFYYLINHKQHVEYFKELLRYIWISGYLLQLGLILFWNWTLIILILRPRQMYHMTNSIQPQTASTKVGKIKTWMYGIFSRFRFNQSHYKDQQSSLLTPYPQSNNQTKLAQLPDNKGRANCNTSEDSDQTLASSKALLLGNGHLRVSKPLRSSIKSNRNKATLTGDLSLLDDTTERTAYVSEGGDSLNQAPRQYSFNRSVRILQHRCGIKKSRINFLIAWLSFCDVMVILNLPIYMKHEHFRRKTNLFMTSTIPSNVTLNISSNKFNLLNETWFLTNASTTTFNTTFYAPTSKTNLTAISKPAPTCIEMLVFYFINDFSGFGNSFSTAYLAYDRFRAIYTSLRFKNSVPLTTPLFVTTSNKYTFKSILTPFFVTVGFYVSMIFLLSKYHTSSSGVLRRKSSEITGSLSSSSQKTVVGNVNRSSITSSISEASSNLKDITENEGNVNLNDSNCKTENYPLKPLMKSIKEVKEKTSIHDPINVKASINSDKLSKQESWIDSKSSSLTSLIQRFKIGHRRALRSSRNEVKAIRMAMVLIGLRTLMVAPLTIFQILEITGHISLNGTDRHNKDFTEINLRNGTPSSNFSVPNLNSLVAGPKEQKNIISPLALHIIVNCMNIFGLTDRWVNVLVIISFCESFKREFVALFKHVM